MSARGRAIQIGLAAVASIVAVLAISVYATRDNLIRYTLNPSRSFAKTNQPTPPDYARNTAWVAKPSKPTKDADIFFIYPTVYFSGEYWNAPTTNPAAKERLARIIRPLYAEPFAKAADLHMPYYRQAAPYSFMSGNENGRAARALAYADVARAFKHYISTSEPSRPFIVAGYGQGALHGLKLLADMKPAERSRLVAAYLLELAVPADTLTELVKGVPLCDSPDQTGCVVIWHSTTQNARGDLPRENALIWKEDGGFEATRGRELICVNPLTWTISGRAGSPDMNLGAARLTDFGPREIAVNAASTSADCWNGLLYTDITPEPIFLWSGPRYRELFPSGINPFYADIADNVERRVAGYKAQQATLQEPPLPEQAKEGETPIQTPAPQTDALQPEPNPPERSVSEPQ